MEIDPQNDFFLKKIWPKEAHMKLYKFNEKVMHGTFLNILIELQQHQEA